METKVDNFLLKTKMTEVLKDNICHVVFTKVDGNERQMTCTLMEYYLPEKKDRNVEWPNSTDSISVWDMEVSDWRAFKASSVTSFNVNGEDLWKSLVEI